MGTLKALCPTECGLCDEVSGVTSVQLTQSQLFDAQTEALGAGVIYEAVFEYNATNSVLTCGFVTVGITVDAETTNGNGSPEKLRKVHSTLWSAPAVQRTSMHFFVCTTQSGRN